MPMLAVVVLLAGCGDDDQGVAPSTTAEPTAAAVVVVEDHDGQFQAATPSPPGLVPQLAEWRLTAEPDGRELQLIAPIGGSCDYFDWIEVEESSERVEIAVHTVHDQVSGCDLYLWWTKAEITLTEPLGGRELDGCAPEVGHSYFDNVVAPGDCASVIKEVVSGASPYVTSVAASLTEGDVVTSLREQFDDYYGVLAPPFEYSVTRMTYGQFAEIAEEVGLEEVVVYPASRPTPYCLPTDPSCGPLGSGDYPDSAGYGTVTRGTVVGQVETLWFAWYGDASILGLGSIPASAVKSLPDDLAEFSTARAE